MDSGRLPYRNNEYTEGRNGSQVRGESAVESRIGQRGISDELRVNSSTLSKPNPNPEWPTLAASRPGLKVALQGKWVDPRGGMS